MKVTKLGQGFWEVTDGTNCLTYQGEVSRYGHTFACRETARKVWRRWKARQLVHKHGFWLGYNSHNDSYYVSYRDTDGNPIHPYLWFDGTFNRYATDDLGHRVGWFNDILEVYHAMLKYETKGVTNAA